MIDGFKGDIVSGLAGNEMNPPQILRLGFFQTNNGPRKIT
jgi:hypothetical protein